MSLLIDPSKLRDLMTKGRFSIHLCNMAHVKVTRFIPRSPTGSSPERYFVIEDPQRGDVKQLLITFGVVMESHLTQSIEVGNGKRQKYIELTSDYVGGIRQLHALSQAFRERVEAWAKGQAIRLSTMQLPVKYSECIRMYQVCKY